MRGGSGPKIAIAQAQSAAELTEAGAIFREYAASLDVDLCFQGFDEELANLPGAYASPSGALLLARVDGVLAGCVAVQPRPDADEPNACELKRLYVRPVFRGIGLGRLLARRAIDCARTGGYSAILLDTLDEMEAARELYVTLGFEEVPPYYFSPLPGAHYLRAYLD